MGNSILHFYLLLFYKQFHCGLVWVLLFRKIMRSNRFHKKLFDEILAIQNNFLTFTLKNHLLSLILNLSKFFAKNLLPLSHYLGQYCFIILSLEMPQANVTEGSVVMRVAQTGAFQTGPSSPVLLVDAASPQRSSCLLPVRFGLVCGVPVYVILF